MAGLPETNQAGIDLQQLVNGAGDAIVVCDAGGAISLWNPAAERLFGFAKENALGQSLDMIIPDRLRGRHWEGYHKTMSTGHTRYGTEVLRVPALHKNGTNFSIAFTVSMLKASDDTVTGIVAIIRDDSKRFAEERDMRTRLAQAEKGDI